MAGRGRARRLRLFLRDHRVVEGSIHLTDGQALAPFLGTRRGWMNLTGVDFVGTGEKVEHVALQTSQILWTTSSEGDIPLMIAPAQAVSRAVEVELEGGMVLHAELSLVPGQRLSDYLGSTGGFIPLRASRLQPRGAWVGNIAVNQAAIQGIQEIEPAAAPRPSPPKQ